VEESSCPLQRHLGVFLSCLPPSYSTNVSTTSLVRKAPRRSFFALQYIQNREPFFSLPLRKAPRMRCPACEESHASGFGYPLAVSQTPYPSEASFSSQHSWASPFRAFFLPSDRSEGFPSPLRSCALLQNHYDLVPALQRLAPTEKAGLLLAPQRFRSGRNLSCSPGLSNLSGSPSANPPRKSSPLLRAPSRPSSSPTSQ